MGGVFSEPTGTWSHVKVGKHCDDDDDDDDNYDQEEHYDDDDDSNCDDGKDNADADSKVSLMTADELCHVLVKVGFVMSANKLTTMRIWMIKFMQMGDGG